MPRWLEASAKEANIAADIVEKIYEASDQQQESISQISLGIGQISDIVEQNFSMTQTSTCSNEALSRLSENLKELLARFKLE